MPANNSANNSPAPDLNLAPHRAKAIFGSKEAWWYEDRAGITVYIKQNGEVHACKIYRAPLRRWLAKVSP